MSSQGFFYQQGGRNHAKVKYREQLKNVLFAYVLSTWRQCCGSGFKLDPYRYSASLWILIRIPVKHKAKRLDWQMSSQSLFYSPGGWNHSLVLGPAGRCPPKFYSTHLEVETILKKGDQLADVLPARQEHQHRPLSLSQVDTVHYTKI